MVLLDSENGAQGIRIRGSAHGVSLKLAELLGKCKTQELSFG